MAVLNYVHRLIIAMLELSPFLRFVQPAHWMNFIVHLKERMQYMKVCLHTGNYFRDCLQLRQIPHTVHQYVTAINRLNAVVYLDDHTCLATIEAER